MKVILIGDLAVDTFVVGRCERLSPERPCPVFLPLSSGSNAGMAGNVEANLRSLDPALEVVTIYPEHPSVKVRYVDKGSNQHLLRVDTDMKSGPLSLDDFHQVLEHQGSVDAVVLSDYGKGLLNSVNMFHIISTSMERNIPTFIDTKGLLGEWSEQATLIKINAKEYANQLAAGIKSPHFWCQNLIVTQGGDGMVWFNQEGGEAHRTTPNPVTVIDSVGCGDTTLAALVVGYLKNKHLPSAMDFAAKASAIAASKAGVVAVKLEEVQ